MLVIVLYRPFAGKAGGRGPSPAPRGGQGPQPDRFRGSSEMQANRHSTDRGAGRDGRQLPWKGERDRDARPSRAGGFREGRKLTSS